MCEIALKKSIARRSRTASKARPLLYTKRSSSFGVLLAHSLDAHSRLPALPWLRLQLRRRLLWRRRTHQERGSRCQPGREAHLCGLYWRTLANLPAPNVPEHARREARAGPWTTAAQPRRASRHETRSGDGHSFLVNLRASSTTTTPRRLICEIITGANPGGHRSTRVPSTFVGSFLFLLSSTLRLALIWEARVF